MTGRRDRASRTRTCSHPDCHEDIAAGAEHYTSPGGCHYHLGCVSAMPEREQPTYTQSGYRPVTEAYCSTVGCGGHVWNYASGLCQRCYRNRQDRERRRREREAVNTYGANGKPPVERAYCRCGRHVWSATDTMVAAYQARKALATPQRHS